MSVTTTLRHRIAVQSKPNGSDANGDKIKEWSEVCKVWADIRTAGGLERIRAGAVASSTQASIRIRTRPGLDASMRIVHGSTTYNILSVPPAELNNVYMDLVCEVIR